LVADICASFAAVETDDLKAAIDDCLARIGLLLGAERAFLARFSNRGQSLFVTNLWTADRASLEAGPMSEDLAVVSPWVADKIRQGTIIDAGAHLDRLPEEARDLRDRLERDGVTSGLVVPTLVEGEPIGMLGLDTVKEPRDYPDSIAQRLQLVADVVGSTLVRLKADAELQRRLEFEGLLAELSATFVNLSPDEVNSRIEAGLGYLGRNLAMDLGTLLQLDPDMDAFRVTHEWRGDDEQDPTEFLGMAIGEDNFPWLASQLPQGRPILISRLGDFPSAASIEREACEQIGVRSVIWVPYEVSSASRGFLAFNTTRAETAWSDNLVQRLRLAGEIFGNAVERARMEREARVALAEIARRAELEALMAELSQRLVQVSTEELEPEIERWLEPIAQAIDVEHVVVGAFSEPNEPESVTVLTWNAGRNVRPLEPPEVPWLVQELFERGQTLPIASMEDLPPEAATDRKTFESVGIRAFVSIPLRCGEDIYGGMSLCALTRDRTWPDDLRSWLGLLGELFANALARRHTNRSLLQALDQSRLAEAALREALDENERLKQRLEADNIYLRDEVAQYAAGEIVGSSPVLGVVLEQATQVAATESTVLILGETGTGKELLAHFIHRNSGRNDRPLVKVNCGALPATLVEAELFGREKGAYTGAMSRQIGRFEIADGTTILLDEIGDLPLELQVKLLRVLEDGQFERLGSTKTLRTDTRVIAATNRNLEEAVREKRFREDLYYRLNVFPITMPSLRERREDIPQLVWTFIRQFMDTMGKPIESVPRRSMEQLSSYSWPGNVRELRNVVERAMITSRGPELVVKPPGAVRAASLGESGSTHMDDVQRKHILEVLERTRWRVRGESGAAERLGMKPSTLESRMQKLGIKRPR
jgi:transcriptional regulator with GAF, ATPase, and Fis domain